MSVTVIVPIYNAEKTLAKCLGSLEKQTYKEFELILINDGSKDKSLDILNEFKNTNIDMDIKIINQTNMGVAKTRNKGIVLAKHDFVMFVDNDDLFENDYIETYLRSIENTELDLVMGGYKRVNDTSVLFLGEIKEAPFSKYVVLAPWAKIYRKETLERYAIEFLDYAIGEDIYFNIKLYQHTKKIKIIPYLGYNWYFNEESVSNTGQVGFKKDIDITYLLDQILKLDNEPSNVSAIRYFCNRYIVWFLLFSGVNATSNQFIDEYNRLKDWRKKSGLKKTFNIFRKTYRGDNIKTKLLVFIFELIEFFHLVPLFAKYYCRKNR